MYSNLEDPLQSCVGDRAHQTFTILGRYLYLGMTGKIKGTARLFTKCGSSQGFFKHVSFNVLAEDSIRHTHAMHTTCMNTIKHDNA